MNAQSPCKFYRQSLPIMLLFVALELPAATLSLESTPLFTSSAVKPNLILSIDDSGSMDFEMLFDSTDGNLWWNTTSQSVADPTTGKPFSDGDARIIYLFPNGTATGARAFDEATFHSIAPLPQFGFARSSDYNNMYYDPKVTYDTWANYGATTFGNITDTAAPSDPVTGTAITVNLTQDVRSDATDHTFRLFSGTHLPPGSQYSFEGTSNWITLAGEGIVSNAVTDGYLDLGITYYPATYYTKVPTGTYSLGATAGDCSTPVIAHYTTYEKNLISLSGSGVDALGPDGSCLKETEIKPATASYPHNNSRTDCASTTTCTYAEEIQNFANWYSYYRKRHLALRAGMGQAFDNINGLRTGLFTINNQTTVSMLDVDVAADYDTFYQTLYNIDGRSGGTPNRSALDHAGQEFMRADASAPITEACQKNFTLAFTDGFSSPGSPPAVGNQDSSEGSPYADTYSDTFADIAMKYYTTVLRTTGMTAGLVPTAVGCSVTPVDPQLDCNTNLHMNTFTVGLGSVGNSIFGVTHNIVADAYATPPTWPDVSAVQDGRQVDDFYHGAVNGRGEMYNATVPQELATKLGSALQGIQSQVGVASAVTFNTATLETNSAIYLAFFNSGNWSGDLVSFDLDSLGNVNLTNTWSAAALLDTPSPVPASRVILTHNGTNGVGFQWASLSPSQQADLNLVPGGNGQDGLNFIRGDRTHEGSGQFRVRGSVLSDIIHSSPVFVGKPNLDWPDTSPFPTTAPERYVDFRSNLIASPRTEVVYFGSNDGMLHGMRASDGQEILAYIPGNLFSTNANEGLHYLADPQYQHKYYVDLASTVSDVYINPTGSYAWHTILVGAQRAGGRGIFALDVTDPTQFTEANAAARSLWEFTHNDIGGNLGLTYSKPTIAMLENGRWAAIFGNGYNDTGTGEAKLFIVFIDGGFDGTWTDGSGGSNLDYILLSTGVGSVATPNGLATPAVVDIDGNGAADRVYAGDLQGNMWVFDLSDRSTLGSPNTVPAWDSAYKNGAVPEALFVAKDSSNNLQPITVKPAIAFHTDPQNGVHDPDVMVFFGTGKYLESTDLTSTGEQTFYGVWDEGGSNLDRSDLVEQTLSTGSFTDSGGIVRTDLRLITDHTVNYNNKHGWFIDLGLAVGERVVVNPTVRGSLVFFNTWIPDSSACNSGGIGFLMSVEQLNGGEPDSPAFNVNADTKVDDGDTVNDGASDHAPAGEAYTNGLPAQSSFLSNKQYTPGTGSKVIETRDVADLGGPGNGRLSWQQLNNN